VSGLNVKVTRENLIKVIEKDKAEVIKRVAKATKDLPALEKAVDVARAAAVEAVLTDKSGVQILDLHSWSGNVEVSTKTTSAKALKAHDAYKKAHDAYHKAVSATKENTVRHDRDLAVLNASEEVNINVRTAGFLGYFQ
jgi:uncharacterized lipoprotein YehR (DUF1307 family)